MKQSLIEGNKYTQRFINEVVSGKLTKTDASDVLGISRPTLDKRLDSNEWKKTEVKFIDMMYS